MCCGKIFCHKFTFFNQTLGHRNRTLPRLKALKLEPFKDYKNVNQSTQALVDDVKFLEATITYFEEQKDGKEYDIEKLREQVFLMRKDLDVLKPTLFRMRTLSRDVLKGKVKLQIF